MADEVKSARQALGRGATDEALVHLWNALEPARLAGDGRSLNAIAGLAQRIRAQGDESAARQAERLIQAVRGSVEEEDGFTPATERLDAEVYAGGEPAEDLQPEEEAGGRAGRIGNLVWLALVLLIVLINVIGQIRGG